MENIDSISLSSIYKLKKSDRDIFQELMPTKVKEVLLLATLYDSLFDCQGRSVYR